MQERKKYSQARKNKNMLSVRQTAEMLGLAYSTFFEHIKKGLCPITYSIPLGIIRFNRQDVEEYLASVTYNDCKERKSLRKPVLRFVADSE